jgi:hypothetical protein
VDSEKRRKWAVRCGLLLLLGLLAVLVVVTAAGPTAAHPPNSTDHNVSNESFHGLWSGDEDAVGDDATIPNGSGREQLAAGTDIPYDSPPVAVEQWNRGDHREFPETDASVSIHPPTANLTDERFIKDAYAQIFAIQPSTRARISPTKQPFYVASNGTLRGVVDYRVAVPETSVSGDRRTEWSLSGHRVTNTTLFVDGTPEVRGGGTHTPVLEYRLGNAVGIDHRLGLRATVSAQVERQIEKCTERNETEGCSNWTINATETFTEQVTITASQQVTEYNLEVSGFVGRYPDGDLGLVVYKNQPWLGYRVPDGEVRGIWRFYSARDTEWDRLVHSTREGDQVTNSPAHPLQVNAYPIATGPTATPARNVTLLGTYGETVAPPTLPDNVRLDLKEEPYTASYGIAARVETSKPLETVQARGLVRGVTVTRSMDAFSRVPIRESNLTLQILNQTEETVVIRAHLRDNQTGTAIATDQRDGTLVIGGQRANTTLSGTVTVTVNRPLGGVSARYEPGDWWANKVGYTASTDTVALQGSTLALISRLFTLLIPVVLFLLAVYLIDRITRWNIWPPWRGL